MTRLVNALMFALVLAGCSREEAKLPADTRYDFEEVKRGRLVHSVSASGTLNPVKLVSVGTQVSGTVASLHADFNQKVAAGQVLARLDPALFEAALASSRANLAQARAALKLALSNESRLKDLLAQEFVSRQEWDAAVEAREAAEARVAQAQAQTRRDEVNLAYSVIRSPVSGMVIDRQVDVGQTVAASFQTPTLFKIGQDLTRMQIDSNLAEADVGHVKPGQHVVFDVDAYPGRDFKGRVRQVRLNATNQQNVVTYNVVVDVPNPDLALLPGMTASLRIELDVRQDVLKVPNAAVRFTPPEDDDPGRDLKGARVYRLNGQVLEAVKIETGKSDGKFSELLSTGLKAGDRLAVGEAEGRERSSAERVKEKQFRGRVF